MISTCKFVPKNTGHESRRNEKDFVVRETQWHMRAHIQIKKLYPFVSLYKDKDAPADFFESYGFHFTRNTEQVIMSFTVRPIEERDKPEWLDMWRGEGSYLEFYKSLHVVPPEATETTFKRFLDPEEPVYSCVAVDDAGKLIGFANYLTHRNTWTICDSLYLNDLFVRSDSRLHGVGKALIEFVYKEADKFGCKKVYWSTQFENHRAQLLYTKVGVKSGFLLYRRP